MICLGLIPRKIIPIIGVSARHGLGNQKRAFDAGAKAFLQKPVDYAELSALIRQARENALGKRVHDLGTIQRRTGGRFDPFEPLYSFSCVTPVYPGESRRTNVAIALMTHG